MLFPILPWISNEPRKGPKYAPPGLPPERKKRIEYKSHQDFFGGMGVWSGMQMQQVETINYAMRRCKIGKITMKA